MAINNAGTNFVLTTQNIRQINSPQGPFHTVGGPYAIIHIDHQTRWALVTLEWDGTPCLGIRWFTGTRGTPESNKWSEWFIVPDILNASILSNSKPIINIAE